MTSTTSSHAGAPFAHMLRSAGRCRRSWAWSRSSLRRHRWGPGAWSAGWAGGRALFFARDVPHEPVGAQREPARLFAVAMTVYLGQVIGLLLFLIAFHGRDWIHGPRWGRGPVVTIVWQVFAMRAMRTARIPVYDESAIRPGEGS